MAGARPILAARSASAPAVPDRRDHLLGVFCVFAAAFFFACKAIFVKLAYRHGVTPVPLLALRMLFSMPFYLLLLLRERQAPPLSGHAWLQLIGLGLAGYYLASLFDFLGLAYVSAGLERLILFLYPTMVLLIGALWQNRRVSRREWVAMVLSYAGIALAFAQDVQLGDPRAALIGGGWVFLSAASYALYIAGAGRLTLELGSVRFTAYALTVSCLAVFAHFALTQPLQALLQPAPVYGLAFAMAVFSTVIPTLLIAEGIRRVGAGTGAIVSAIGPALTIVLSATVLGEAVTALQLAGMALVVGGVLWVSRAQAAAPRSVR